MEHTEQNKVVFHLDDSCKWDRNHMANSNSNKLVVPGARQVIDNLKMEIASEFGVSLDADAKLAITALSGKDYHTFITTSAISR